VGFLARLKAFFRGEPKSAGHAREFNRWLVDREHGWLADYPLPNVICFDYYDVLTDYGASNWSRYPTKDGRNSHPSAVGNSKAAEAFIPYLNDAVTNLGWRE